MNFVFVALGGGLGAVCRYAISLIPCTTVFPVLTLVTNLIGAVIIGVIVGLTDKSNEKLNLFIKTGFCGGFTTFSTFSLEAYNLFNGKHYALGVAYSALSVVLCISGVMLGKIIGEKLK